MAKGQKRSGREPKKPKKDKLLKGTPASGSGLRTAQKPTK
jgi:hypothetical protein